MSSDVWYSGQPGRSELTGGANAIQRNRDGVPTWSGETVLFEEYVEACLLYEQTVAREKRYLCGPRLASELTKVSGFYLYLVISTSCKTYVSKKKYLAQT